MTDPVTLPPIAAECDCAYARMYPLKHDRWRRVEVDPALIVEAVTLAHSWRENVYEHGMMTPEDFREFVGNHNWANPVVMWDLAHLLGSIDDYQQMLRSELTVWHPRWRQRAAEEKAAERAERAERAKANSA